MTNEGTIFKPKRYFRGSRTSKLHNRFNPKALAEDILMCFLVKTYRGSGSMFIKEKHTEEPQKWYHQGETYLKEAIVKMLGEFYRKEFMDQTISYIKGLTYVWKGDEAKDPMELDREEKIDLERFF